MTRSPTSGRSLATAAQLGGLGPRMLDLTTAYVKTRHHFGVPVGAFHAVKHRLADALLALEFAEPAVLAAGWAVPNADEETSRAVSLAVVLAIALGDLCRRPSPDPPPAVSSPGRWWCGCR